MAALSALAGAPMYFVKPYVATIETMAIVNTYLAYGVPIFFKCVGGGWRLPVGAFGGDKLVDRP